MKPSTPVAWPTSASALAKTMEGPRPLADAAPRWTEPQAAPSRKWARERGLAAVRVCTSFFPSDTDHQGAESRCQLTGCYLQPEDPAALSPPAFAPSRPEKVAARPCVLRHQGNTSQRSQEAPEGGAQIIRRECQGYDTFPNPRGPQIKRSGGFRQPARIHAGSGD